MLARTARVPATHGSLPDAASQVVACLDGPFGAGCGSPAGRRRRRHLRRPLPRRTARARASACSPCATPTSTAEQVDLADAVVASAREAGVTVWEQEARSGPPIERLASLVALTDFAATYLALGLGLDPSVSRHVTELRDRTS